MAVPCCVPDPTGITSRICVQLPIEDCRAIHDALPGPEGMACEEQGGCWHCTRLDGGGIPDIGCCYGGDVWLDDVPARLNCTRCGGEFMDEDDCIPPPPDPECVAAGEDRADRDRRTWSIDQLGTVAIGLDEQVGFEGVTRFITTHMVRGVARAPGVDPCAHLEATPVIVGGEIFLEVCSQPSDLHDYSTRAGLASIGVVDSDDELQDGDAVHYGNIRLPPWTEATYRSYKARCGDIPV